MTHYTLSCIHTRAHKNTTVSLLTLSLPTLLLAAVTAHLIRVGTDVYLRHDIGHDDTMTYLSNMTLRLLGEYLVYVLSM